jgi:hypothetical protein
MTKIHRKWASKTPRVTLTAVVLHGEGYLDNMTISGAFHNQADHLGNRHY